MSDEIVESMNELEKILKEYKRIPDIVQSLKDRGVDASNYIYERLEETNKQLVQSGIFLTEYFPKNETKKLLYRDYGNYPANIQQILDKLGGTATSGKIFEEYLKINPLAKKQTFKVVLTQLTRKGVLDKEKGRKKSYILKA